MKSLELKRARPWQWPLLILASSFGLGLSPFASGTFGTLPGLMLAALLRQAGVTGLVQEATATLLLALAAVPICDLAERHFGRKDDGRITADEFMTFPLCMLGLPMEGWVLAVAFLTNRFFDILKPPPARGLQRLRGGLGVVADDTVSALYSLAANHLVVWFVTQRLSDVAL